MADAGNGGQPSVGVLAQYVKDLSFENPGAPDSLKPRAQAPAINIAVGVQPQPKGGNDVEVELRIEARGVEGETVLFALELVYAGLFRVSNMPQESLEPFLLIECPRLLFPFARQIISDASRNGGFPPLLLDPIDFVSLYQKQMASQGRGPGVAPPPN